MTSPACPNCNKSIQHRHTYMTTFPLTLVCSGCGSWLKLDVRRSGSLVILALCFVTLGLAYFSPYFLVLLPLYFVASMGPLQSFSVSLIKKRRAELWTISRRTGALRPMTGAEKEAQQDLQLSKKLIGARPFRAVQGGKHRRRRCDDGLTGQSKAHGARPDYSLKDLPTGLPQ